MKATHRAMYNFWVISGWTHINKLTNTYAHKHPPKHIQTLISFLQVMSSFLLSLHRVLIFQCFCVHPEKLCTNFHTSFVCWQKCYFLYTLVHATSRKYTPFDRSWTHELRKVSSLSNVCAIFLQKLPIFLSSLRFFHHLIVFAQNHCFFPTHFQHFSGNDRMTCCGTCALSRKTVAFSRQITKIVFLLISYYFHH